MSPEDTDAAARSGRLLADSPERSYASKLECFEAFIAPELRKIFADLSLPRSGTVADLGCGTGLATALLAECTSVDATVVGIDLSMPHLRSARRAHSLPLVQADMLDGCFKAQSLDFIWCCNTINHALDPVSVLKSLRSCLNPNGRLAIAQSGLLPDMFFAWDARLDDAVRAACHSYYRERYGLSRRDTAALRGLVRMLHEAGFSEVTTRTYTIERVQPLEQADRAYFLHAVFEGLWGEKIRPWLEPEEWAELTANCDPRSSRYCLDRDDFHHIQTLTVSVGCVPSDK